jgi:ribose transport system substrate-binding protein
MWGPRTELKTYAPAIKTLDVQSPGFDAPTSRQVVADWITRFGKDINAIIVSDDSSQAIGAADAIIEAGRNDILIAAPGPSKAGLDLVASGSLVADTYQTAEGDGAACIWAMAEFFNGKELPSINYFVPNIITKETVSGYQPAQW